MVRLHFDESVRTVVAHGLRAHGIDVTTARECGLLSAADEEQLSFATTEGRVLVCHDSDFPTIHASGVDHAGICYCHRNKYSIGELLRALILVCECYSQEEFVGRLEYL